MKRHLQLFNRHTAWLVAGMVCMICLGITGVGKAQTWEALGPNEFNRPSLGPALYTSIAIDGNGLTYVAYQDGANDFKATVMKFSNGMWEPVGKVGFSAGPAYYTSIAIDLNGTLYVAYQDYGNFYKATVMKFNGTNWEPVGTPGFSAQGVTNTSIAINANGSPYVVFQDYDNLYKATVMKFNGTNWEVVGNPGFSAGRVDYTSIKFDNTDVPYVVYKDYGYDQKVSVMKYNGTNWENVGIAGISVGLADYPTLTFGGDGSPYVAFSDGGNGYKATVMKFDGSDWTSVGNPGFSPYSADVTSIAIDNGGKPYIAFRSNANYATVMQFDGTNWIITGNSNISIGTAYYICIVIDQNGAPNIIYQDHGFEQMAIVKKLNGIIWETVGADPFSPGTAFFSAITVNENDMPYVAYSDGGYGGKTTVKRYNGTYWETIGNEGISEKSTMFNSIAFDGNGTPYVAFCEFLGGDLLKPSIMKFNGTSWEYVGSSQLTQYGGMYTDIAIDANGTPYVVYSERAIDNSWKATVIKFDGSNWISAGNSRFSSGYSGYNNIAIDNIGTPYVVYRGVELTYPYKAAATVMKLNTISNIWEHVGDPAISTGEVQFTDIAIDHNGIPYVVYTDFAYSEKVTVMKFNGTNWEPVGTPGFTDGYDRFTSIAIDNSGKPFVAFEDIYLGGTKVNATVMKYNGSSWEVVGNPRFSRGQAYYMSMALDGNGNPIVAFDNRGAWAYKFENNCLNPASGGSIAGNQSGCNGFNPDPITSTALPSGHSGTLEYKWQQSTLSSSSGFTDITGSNEETFDPGAITVTTWYRRLAKVTCNSDWIGAAESNAIMMTVNSSIPASVSITASANPVCAGTSVTFTMTTINGGDTPSYQWKLGGEDIVGETGNTYSYTPKNGDLISVVMTSSIECATGNPATSNTVTMSVLSTTAPTVGNITQPTCVVSTGSVILSGLPSGNWTINPGGITGSTTSTTVSGLNPGTYNFTVTNSFGCISPASADVVINVPSNALPAPTVTLIQPSCTVPTGSITITSPLGKGITYSIGGKYQATTTFSKLVSGNYNVTARNSSGCISPVTTVEILPNPAPAQPGNFTTSTSQVTQGQSNVIYTVPFVAGVTYSWSYSGTGATILGSSNSVSVSFSSSATSGILSVTASNGECTSSPRSINIKVNRLKSGQITEAMKPLTDASIPENDLKIYPNPFTEKLTFEFSNQTDAHARLDIYSITGAKLATLFDGNIRGGEVHTVEYLPKLISSQMVMYQLVLGEKIYIGKVLFNERK